jgi:ribonuclease Y
VQAGVVLTGPTRGPPGAPRAHAARDRRTSPAPRDRALEHRSAWLIHRWSPSSWGCCLGLLGAAVGFSLGRRAGSESGQAAGRAAGEAAGLATGREEGRAAGRKEELERQQAAQATAEDTARRILAEAQRDAESLKKSAIVSGKEELLRVREAQDAEVRQRREEVDREERRVQEREAQLDRKRDEVDQRDRELGRRATELGRREKVLVDRQTEVERVEQDANRRLEELAGLSAADARAELMRRMEEQAHADAANRIREIRETARRNAEREAKKIVALAVQRIAAEHTAETTVSSVALPNDEMKGRIIGREGRNIRAFELATGVDVIIDDTPDTVVVSCFEPVRREVARQALEKLVSDGRIHPGPHRGGRHEGAQEVEKQIVETGEAGGLRGRGGGAAPEIVKLIGRMKWRTSYGQNILQHSKEVAWLAGIMAAELGLDVALAKRGALLPRRGQGAHARARGDARAARRRGGDALRRAPAGRERDRRAPRRRAARERGERARAGGRRDQRLAPGARREAFETYVKRLEGLERIASSYRGVEKVFAIQAGREVRIVVTPDEVDDVRMGALSEEIARRIEQELQYPGRSRSW